MLHMLLESIFIYGQLNDSIDILIYTSYDFMYKIKQSHLYTDKIKFEINDSYTSIDKACKARLDIFDFPSIQKYNKILYLDTDIIVKGSLEKVFDSIECTEEKLYAVEEGTIDSETDFWGKSLFGDELDSYPEKDAFSSGILLFNNCTKVKQFFDIVKSDMKSRSHFFHDQPYIVYNAFKYNMYNNKVLKSLCVNNNYNVMSDKSIHHFPGGPGEHLDKLRHMNTFLTSLKDNTITQNIEKTKEYINTYLMPIISECGEKLEGNIFMLHEKATYTDLYLPKAKNISNVVLNTNIKRGMEIGFNAGFSTLLMLFSNPNLYMTCFDLGEHSYTLPCFQQLKKTFGKRISILLGDSTKVLPSVDASFDFIHIDGGHETEIVISDIRNCYRFCEKQTIVIMDDYDFTQISRLWDEHVKLYSFAPLDIHIYRNPYQDIRFMKMK